MATQLEQRRVYIASQILQQPGRPIPEHEALISRGLNAQRRG